MKIKYGILEDGEEISPSNYERVELSEDGVLSWDHKWGEEDIKVTGIVRIEGRERDKVFNIDPPVYLSEGDTLSVEITEIKT